MAGRDEDIDRRTKFNKDPDGLVEHALKHARQGDPEDVLRVIDDYCWKNRPHMNVGDTKGRILDGIFKEKDPAVAVELGGFIGYSAVRLARMLKSGGKLYTIEIDQHSAENMKKVTDHAGVGEKVTIVNQSSGEAIPSLKDKYGVDGVDFVFIDHEKSLYKPDLIRMIEAGLLRKGTVVVADNVVSHNITDYVEFVRNHPQFTSECFESILEYSPQWRDALEKSVYLG